MSGASTTEILGPIAQMLTGTHVATPTVQQETFTGSNSALYIRVYMLSGPSYGSTQLHVFDPWKIASAVSSPITDNIDVTPYVPCYIGITIQGNNSGVTTWRAWVSVLTDLGLATSLNANGCCHDPMLDTILAAVRRTFPTT